MKKIERILNISLPKDQSAFLWGPRKTGKTTFLRTSFPNSFIYDLLQTDLFLEFAKRPFLLREQILAFDPRLLKIPVIIDEVQKSPQLLDEIHSYKELDYEVNFWRTKTGLEVDFILGRGEVAIEVKGSSSINRADLRPIKAFKEEYRPRKAFVVCNERQQRAHEGIMLMPWREFLHMLWDGGVIS